VNVQNNDFYRAFALVFGGLMLFTVSIVWLANMISVPNNAYTDPLVQAQMKERVRPVGQSRIAIK